MVVINHLQITGRSPPCWGRGLTLDIDTPLGSWDDSDTKFKDSPIMWAPPPSYELVFQLVYKPHEYYCKL